MHSTMSTINSPIKSHQVSSSFIFEIIAFSSIAAVINPPKQRLKHLHNTSRFTDNASVCSGASGSVFSDLETQASLSEFIGPGAYNVKYSVVEPKKGFALPKSKRFAEPKKDLVIDL